MQLYESIKKNLNEAHKYDDYYNDLEDCKFSLQRAEIGEDISSIDDIDEYVKDGLPEELFKDYDKAVKGINDLNKRVDKAVNFLNSLLEEIANEADPVSPNKDIEFPEELKQKYEKLKKQCEKLLREKFSELKIKDTILNALSEKLNYKLVLENPHHEDCYTDYFVLSSGFTNDLACYINIYFEIDAEENRAGSYYWGYGKQKDINKALEVLEKNIDLLKQNKVKVSGNISYDTHKIDAQHYARDVQKERYFSYKPNGAVKISAAKDRF